MSPEALAALRRAAATNAVAAQHAAEHAATPAATDHYATMARTHDAVWWVAASYPLARGWPVEAWRDPGASQPRQESGR